MKELVLMAYLFCSQPVCTIQMDLETTGQVMLDPAITTKQMTTAPISGGVRVLIFGLNQVAIQGRLLHTTGPVTAIRNVVASDPNGKQVMGAYITYLVAPINLRKK